MSDSVQGGNIDAHSKAPFTKKRHSRGGGFGASPLSVTSASRNGTSEGTADTDSILVSGSIGPDLSLSVVPLRERAAAAIREAIFTGKLAPGSEIRQEEMAERFSISRMPIREAFQILEREELIERKSHRRAIVRAFTATDIIDHYETRAFVEGELAARAAGRTLAHDAVRAAFERAAYLARDADPASFGRGSRIFHEAIWEAAGSRRLAKLAASLWTGLPIHLPEIVPAMVPRSNDAHREICDAVLSGDPEAARRSLSDHIMGSLPAFLQNFTAERIDRHDPPRRAGA